MADSGIASELEKLANLKSAGILTDEEFEQQKRQLLQLPDVVIKKSKEKKFSWRKIVLVLIGFLGISYGNHIITKNNEYKESLGTNGLPKCDSKLAYDDVKKAVNDSPAGKTMGVSFIDIKNIETITTEDNVTLCHGTILTNSGETDSLYKFTGNRDNYIISVHQN